MAALLVDEGVSRDLVRQPAAQGYDVLHWLDFGQKGDHDALIFLAAQQRQLTIFRWNRDDFVFAATCWHAWGHGDHQGLIVPKSGKYHAQLVPVQLYPLIERFCADTNSFLNRIETF